MRLKAFALFCLLAVFAMTGLSLAQEGHPLTGVWYGDWGPTPTHRNQITVVLSWDGKNISGIVNPGPESIPIRVATLDSTKWMVHMEADTKDPKGIPIRFIADGKLENIGSYNRTLKGTWNHGNIKGDFLIKRD